MQFGNFRLFIIRECFFKLDGGAMFGVVPKTLWNKVSPADEANRVPLSCNLLLIETDRGHVLIETGMGPRWSAVEKERYALETLIDHKHALSHLGLSNQDVNYVLISHLHFDHVGGATLLKEDSLVPTFPNAKYLIQKGEWEFAQKPNARAKASYRRDDFMPLAEHGVLNIVDGNAEVLPGIRVHVTGGHTSHHQVVTFESQDKKGIYFADIIPTKSHLSPPWVMGYDHFPLISCDLKSYWLELAAKENWLVVFDHEIGVPWGHVQLSAKGQFEFFPLAKETLAPNPSLAY